METITPKLMEDNHAMNYSTCKNENQPQFSNDEKRNDATLFLPPEKLPTYIALDEGWGPAPPTVHNYLKEKGCFDAHCKLITLDLLSMVSLKERVTLDNFRVYSGWTIVCSISGLAARNGMSERKIYYVIKQLEDKGVIERQKVGKCYKFRVKIIYKPAIQRSQEDPDRLKQQVVTFAPKPAQSAEIEKEASHNPAPCADLLEDNPAPCADILDLEALQEESSSSALGTGTGMAESMPTVEGEEEEENLSDPQKAEKQEVGPAEPVALPAAVPTEAKAEEKNSLREKQAVDFFEQQKDSLTDEFHKTLGRDYVMSDTKSRHAEVICDHLCILFREPDVRNFFPDELRRAEICVEIFAASFPHLKKLPETPKTPGIYTSDPGQSALSEATAEIITKHKWSTGGDGTGGTDTPDQPEAAPASKPNPPRPSDSAPPDVPPDVKAFLDNLLGDREKYAKDESRPMRCAESFR